MSAALLSYTDEGQDWASRCPPIAADALSFFAFCHRSQRRCPGIFRASLVVGALVPLKKGLWSAERQAPTKRDCAAFQLLRAAAVGVHKCAQRHGGGTTMLVRTFATLLVLAIGGFATALVANGKDRGRHHTREPDANWVLLATRSIDLKKEDDRIEIGANKGRFTS